MRKESALDRLLGEFDTGLRTVFAVSRAARAMPQTHAGSPNLSAVAPLSPIEAAESARLMRVNHTGEVCAQALYQGQAALAKTPKTRALLKGAANEERDHLAWCEERIRTLGGHTSRLNPIFYAGSFALGAASGLLADRWSLGFLVETERQVEAHLTDHLARISIADTPSRAIIDAMRADEIEHGETALAAGAAELPEAIKKSMRLASGLMTRTTYWV